MFCNYNQIVCVHTLVCVCVCVYAFADSSIMEIVIMEWRYPGKVSGGSFPDMISICLVKPELLKDVEYSLLGFPPH